MNGGGQNQQEIVELSCNEAVEFVMKYHYAGRKPQVTKAFGWYINRLLFAVCTFGKPASNSLCIGICGKEYANQVYELNRLVRLDNFEFQGLQRGLQLSQFISGCLRKLIDLDWIIVSYSDTGMNHHGYIYQACNFLYTGVTTQRTDKYTEGKHSRHSADNKDGIRQVRTAKHRYIYFNTKSKKLKKEYMSSLKYPILEYPKGNNENYELGHTYKPVLIDKERKIINGNDKYVMKVDVSKFG